MRDKQGNHQYYQPRRHDESKQMWRDFAAIADSRNGHRRPGVVNWVNTCKISTPALKKNRVSFRIASVQYGDKDFFVNHVFGDQLSFHAALLSETGAPAYERVLIEVTDCESAANTVGRLARNLYLAAGGHGVGREAALKAQFFDMIDAPFRRWLAELDPVELDACCIAWHDIARGTALQLGKMLIE